MNRKHDTEGTASESNGLRKIVDLRLQEKRHHDRRVEQTRYLEQGFPERRKQERRVKERRSI